MTIKNRCACKLEPVARATSATATDLTLSDLCGFELQTYNIIIKIHGLSLNDKKYLSTFRPRVEALVRRVSIKRILTHTNSPDEGA